MGGGRDSALGGGGGVAFGIPPLTCIYLSFLGKLDFRCPSARSLDLIPQIKRGYA